METRARLDMRDVLEPLSLKLSMMGCVPGEGSSRKGSLVGSGGAGSKRRRSLASPCEVDEMSLYVGASGRPRSISLSSVETDDNDQEGGAVGPAQAVQNK